LWTLDNTIGSICQVAGIAASSGAENSDPELTILLAKSYSPYGETIDSVGDFNTSFGFTGEMTDDTGLINLRARWYAPGQGRFITKDSWIGDYKDPITLVKWVCANANPVLYVDPSGLKTVYYDREAAVKYALKWATSVNFVEYGPKFGDRDCTNFVSQSLKAGGLPEDDEWFFTRPGLISGNCSTSNNLLNPICGPAWALTDKLFNHLTDKLKFEKIKITPNDFEDNQIPKTPIQLPLYLLRDAQKGDVVFYKQNVEYVINGGLYNHAAIIVGKGTMTYHGVKVNAQALNITDHSGPYPNINQHTINDNQANVLELLIVHIPDIINIDDTTSKEEAWIKQPFFCKFESEISTVL